MLYIPSKARLLEVLKSYSTVASALARNRKIDPRFAALKLPWLSPTVYTATDNIVVFKTSLALTSQTVNLCSFHIATEYKCKNAILCLY